MQVTGALRPTSAPPSSVSADGAFERECAKFFGETARVIGVPPSVGQIYGLLYASPEPLSFTDIVGQLNISNGSASQGLQLLRSLGAVRSLEVENDRREYFEPELGLRRLVGGVLRERIVPLATAGSDRLEGLRDLAERSGAAKNFHLKRVRQLTIWRKRLRLVLPVLDTLLGPKEG